MKIAGESWIETKDSIRLNLDEPYWGAWTKWGWPENTWGASISLEALEYAKIQSKRLIISTEKYGAYITTPFKVLKHGKPTYSKTGVPMICVPKFAFKSLPIEVETEIINISPDARLKLRDIFNTKIRK